jgi:hypothetical protein
VQEVRNARRTRSKIWTANTEEEHHPAQCDPSEPVPSATPPPPSSVRGGQHNDRGIPGHSPWTITLNSFWQKAQDGGASERAVRVSRTDTSRCRGQGSYRRPSLKTATNFREVSIEVTLTPHLTSWNVIYKRRGGDIGRGPVHQLSRARTKLTGLLERICQVTYYVLWTNVANDQWIFNFMNWLQNLVCEFRGS